MLLNVFVIIVFIIWIIDKVIRNFVNLYGKLSVFRDVYDDVNEIWVNRKLIFDETIDFVLLIF